MARIITYTFVFAGLLALMAMGGLPTASSSLLQALAYGDISNWAVSTLFVAAGYIFALAATVGVIVGLFTKQSTESTLVAAIAASLLTIFITDMVSIVNYFNSICPVGSGCSFVSKIVFLMMLLMAGGFIISIIQWWRGNDI